MGKTVLARSLARSIDCKFSRIQLTPDLLPSDVLGVSIFNNQTQSFDFKPGPVFANIVLADEVNRTTPRTQSALLEAMSEEQVSVENQTFVLQRPFMLVATQNPFEFEGTYHLPENQMDRFLVKVRVGYPERRAEQKILQTQPGRDALSQLHPVMSGTEVVEMQDAVPKVRLDPAILDYVLDLVEGTRESDELRLGVSPRGALALTQAVAGVGHAQRTGLRHARRREIAFYRRLRAPRARQGVSAKWGRWGDGSDPQEDSRRNGDAAMKRSIEALMFWRSSPAAVEEKGDELTVVRQRPGVDVSLTGFIYGGIMLFMGLAAMQNRANVLFGIFGLMIGTLLVSGVISRMVVRG